MIAQFIKRHIMYAVLGTASLVLGLLVTVVSATPSYAATFTVTNTNDSGVGSLRQAITNANATAGADTIAFAIAGSGVHTITPLTTLPQLTDETIVDGFTQTGASANTALVNQAVNAQIRIEIDAVNLASSAPALALYGDNSIARGLSIFSSATSPITSRPIGSEVEGEDDIVAGNFIGLRADGSTGCLQYGVSLKGSVDTLVGGVNAADRNVVSCNATNIDMGTLPGGGPGATASIKGNFLGAGLDGNFINLASAQTLSIGVSEGSAAVGGSTDAERNVMIDFATYGTGTVSFDGNYIGVNAAGTQAVTTGQFYTAQPYFILSQNVTLTMGVVRGNVIVAPGRTAFINTATGPTIENNTFGALPNGTASGLVGVVIVPSTAAPGSFSSNTVRNASGYGVAIGGASAHIVTRYNSFDAISGLDIDLFDGGLGVTQNDLLDGDTGANGLLNFPVITAVDRSTPTGKTRIRGTLNSLPNATFEIDLYVSANLNASGHGEATTFLQTATVTTDADGNASFEVLADGVANGAYVSATATSAANETSELSESVTALATDEVIPAPQTPPSTSPQPGSGSASGGELAATGDDAFVYLAIALGLVAVSFTAVIYRSQFIRFTRRS